VAFGSTALGFAALGFWGSLGFWEIVRFDSAQELKLRGYENSATTVICSQGLPF